MLFMGRPGSLLTSEKRPPCPREEAKSLRITSDSTLVSAAVVNCETNEFPDVSVGWALSPFSLGRSI